MNSIARIKKALPLLLMFLVCVASSVSAQQEETVIAMVIRINGRLDFRKAAGDDWEPAAVRQSLHNGNQLRTELGNKAVIVYTSSGTRILVNENTELEIQAQMPPGKFAKPTSERTKLIIGEVYSKISEVKKDKPNYEVETPSSVASVRGTEFNVQFTTGEAIFLVMLNQVDIENNQGSTTASQYQMVRVPMGEPPSEPEQLSKGQAEKATNWTQKVDPIWKLNLVPEGGTSQPVGEPFGLTVWAENKETGMIDTNASFTLAMFGADSDVVEFSTDNGKNWTSAPEVSLTNGQIRLMVQGASAGTATIKAEADDSEPASLSVTVATPKEKKTIELKFADPDGSNEESLIIDLEEK